MRQWAVSYPEGDNSVPGSPRFLRLEAILPMNPTLLPSASSMAWATRTPREPEDTRRQNSTTRLLEGWQPAPGTTRCRQLPQAWGRCISGEHLNKCRKAHPLASDR